MIPTRRARLQSSVLRKRRRRRFLFKSLIALAVPILLISSVGFVLRVPQITISKIYVEGQSIVSKESLRAITEEIIRGSYFYIFPKRNIFIYPKEEIKNRIIDSLKSVETVEINFRDFESVTVSISERKPVALWCKKSIIEEQKSSCYFLDKTGFIFSKAPEFTEGVFFRYSGSVLANNPIGIQFLPEDAFQRIERFTAGLKQEKFALKEITSKENGMYEGVFEAGGKLLFNDAKDLNETLNRLLALIESDSFRGKDKDGNLRVEYIDLQNGNKIFYKPR